MKHIPFLEKLFSLISAAGPWTLYVGGAVMIWLGKLLGALL